MAQRVIRQIIDDLDQTEIPETEAEHLEFAFRGVNYQLDLSKTNAVKFEEALRPYITAAVNAETETESEPPANRARPRAAARKAMSRRRGTAKTAQVKADTAEIRAWANDNGFSLSPRGRIPAVVAEAYQAAHG